MTRCIRPISTYLSHDGVEAFALAHGTDSTVLYIVQLCTVISSRAKSEGKFLTVVTGRGRQARSVGINSPQHQPEIALASAPSKAAVKRAQEPGNMLDTNWRVRMIFSLALAATLSLFASAGAFPDSSASAPSDPSTSAFVPPAAPRASSASSSTRTWYGVKPTATSSSASRVADNRACVAAERSANAGRTRGVWLPRLAQRPSSKNGMSMAALSSPRIIIAGAPASGKGTQCNMIKEKYGVVHLSTGI